VDLVPAGELLPQYLPVGNGIARTIGSDVDSLGSSIRQLVASCLWVGRTPLPFRNLTGY